MNGYEAIAKILKQEGVEWMACFPANPLIEAVAKEASSLKGVKITYEPPLLRHFTGKFAQLG